MQLTCVGILLLFMTTNYGSQFSWNCSYTILSFFGINDIGAISLYGVDLWAIWDIYIFGIGYMVTKLLFDRRIRDTVKVQ